MRFKGPPKYVEAARLFAEILGLKEINAKVEIRKVKQTKYAGELVRKRKKMILEASSVRAVAHEMVHVKQFLKHQLVESKPLVFWNGEPSTLTQDLDSDEYWLAPWEMEARAYEDYLLHKWYGRDR